MEWLSGWNKEKEEEEEEEEEGEGKKMISWLWSIITRL